MLSSISAASEILTPRNLVYWVSIRGYFILKISFWRKLSSKLPVRDATGKDVDGWKNPDLILLPPREISCT
jgi:hypothetical protein